MVYMAACSKNIYPAGPQLIEKAKQIADVLGIPEFKGSNGWPTKWKNRYNIKKVRICGESGDVRGETVQSWKERLPEILRGYSKEDIWNIDGTYFNRKERHAEVGRRVNKGKQWHFLLQLMEKKKSQLLSGTAKIQDV